jgi:acyl transferase domain-containing protein/acyl-CoA synthetase (AMP-forming)/AMP-acid ligase II/NADPH:quinone reductase-like Zn-dependent oxidoreductase/short-subunit dehydrogenase/acyl carrier protein
MVSLVGMLQSREDMARTWLTFHGDKGEVQDSRTGTQLLARAQAVAAHLRQDRRLSAGDRVLLVFPPSLQFVDALAGCLLAGIVAVPMPPPDPSGSEAQLLHKVAEDCGARAILTESSYERARTLGRLRRWAGLQRGIRWPDLPWIAVDGLRRASFAPVEPALSDVALLQYTSGSTGDPKGVRLTHQNLVHQLELNRVSLKMGPDSRLGMWVPHFHDFGLISGICSALRGNGTLAMQSPLTFLQRPASWLELLSRHALTHTASPNFGYELAVRKTTPEQRRGWDLSALVVAMSAAEPVRVETLQRFEEAFRPSGLRSGVLCPAYGLAEHTVGVTVGGKARIRLGSGLWQTGCGTPGPGVVVHIVDPATRRVLPEGREGEIWVDSPSKADGYEGRSELTREVFQAQLVPADGRGYLRTGDLGAFVQGELVITGRHKDLVLLRGKNVHPSDVEDAARAAHPAIRPGGLAAFGRPSDSGTEELVLFVELADEGAEPGEVTQAIRLAVARAMGGIHVDLVVLGRRGLVPKTTSGKVRRSACRERMEAPEVLARLGEPAPAPVVLPAGISAGLSVERLAQIASSVLGRPLGRDSYDVPWRELGMSSVQLVSFCAAVQSELGMELSVERLFEAPTLLALAQGAPAAQARPEARADEPIAVLGLACRFPGGLDTPSALWAHFLAGARPAGQRLAVEDFDPVPFGLSEREARAMAPEQRLALELAWEALQSAGFAPDRVRGLACGVFLGTSAMEYGLRTLYGGRPDAWSALGNMPSVVAGRLSYTLGLTGPAMVVDTACSSSLVAVHLAMQALARGECELALVGGVNVALAPETTEALRSLGALSPTGRCWSFDERADGYARTDGAGMILLCRASSVPTHTTPWALLLGSATNQDGRSNGLSAPNPAAQRAVIRAAWASMASPCTFLEAHGSGTPLGDSLELQALEEALPGERVRVSAAKGNLGHAEASAGIAGLLRAVLAVHHGVIPPQSDHETPTRKFAWEGSRLEVPRTAQPLPEPRLAGVSAFGLSGTNAHVVVGPASPAQRAVLPERPQVVLAVTGHSEAAARARACGLAEVLDSTGGLRALAARHHRVQPQHRWRLAVTASDPREAAQRLRAEAPVERGEPRIAFVFPGQGSLGPGDLARMREEPQLREPLDEALALLVSEAGESVLNALLDGDGPAVQRTEHAQPGLVAAGWALWRLWTGMGLQPTVVAGHSVGELCAAAAAGVVSWPDALRLAVRRGALAGRAPEGAMLAVRAEQLPLPPPVRVAAHNGPRDLVLAGPVPEIEALAAQLRARGVAVRRLPVRHAFHTPDLVPMAAQIEEEFARWPLAEPKLRWLSSRDGQPLASAPPAHWGAQLVEPVRWDAVTCALGREVEAVLELGPGDGLVRQGRRALPGLVWIAGAELDSAAAELHRAGAALDWAAWDGPCDPLQVELPPVAWQKRRLWIEASARPVASDALGEVREVAGAGTLVELGLGGQEYLLQHQVGGRALVPAAWTMSWLGALAGRLRGPEAALVNLTLHKPVPWLAELGLQALVTPDGAVTVHARAGSSPWELVATARLEVGGALEGCEPLGSPAQPVPYAELAAKGLEYGPVFQRLTEVQLDPAGADGRLSELAAPSPLLVHPAVLDASFHAAATWLLGEVRGSWLPSAVDRYGERRALGERPWCRLRRTVGTSQSLRFDGVLGDDQGVAIAFEGLELRQVSPPRSEVVVRTWRAEPALPELPGRWVVVGSGAEQAAAVLTARGHAARAASPSQRSDPHERVLLLVDPADAPLEALERCRAVARAVEDKGRVVVVTRQGQAAGEDEPLSEGAAATWGFVRSLRRETQMAWRLVDIGADPLEQALERALDGEEPEVLLRQERLVPGVEVPALSLALRGPFEARRSSRGRLAEVALHPALVRAPGPGQVRLAVTAAALNFRDLLVALGVVPGPERRGLGGECVGTVVACGPGVSLPVGQAVVALAPGALASHVLADSAEVVPLPEGLSPHDAATLPIAYATAWHALVNLASVRPGEKILVHAATGGVGLAAVHLARSLGAEVFATAHPSKWPTLRALGVTHVASSRDTSFAEDFRKDAPLDVVLDANTGEMVDAGLSLLGPGGRFLELGKRDVRDPQLVMAHTGVRYVAFDLAELGPARRGELLRIVLAACADGRLPALPRSLWPVGQLGNALRFMSEAKHQGKIVLTVPAPPGGAALVTGGTGALGQQLARFLVARHGVDKLVLMGRKAEPAQLGPELAALQAAGVAIELVRGDVSVREDVGRALERAGETLRWVVHAAGVLDDGPALRQSRGRIQGVLEPKLAGARHLDELTRGRSLRGFVILGSAAAEHGPAGQAAYAAANAGLAAVVRRRRLRGEPALLVAPGPVSGPGMASSPEARRAFQRQGTLLLDPQDVLDRLEEAWAGGLESVVVMAKVHSEKPAPIAVSPGADPIREAVARVLGGDPPEHRTLAELGLDSIAGIELRNELSRIIGRELPPQVLDPSKTLAQLRRELSAPA